MVLGTSPFEVKDIEIGVVIAQNHIYKSLDIRITFELKSTYDFFLTFNHMKLVKSHNVKQRINGIPQSVLHDLNIHPILA